jgi:zinc protease
MDEILLLADELRLNGVTAEELVRAKEPMITSIGDSMKQNNYWLYSVLSQSARFPQKLEWPRTIMSDYSSITKSDIDMLAKHYMDNAKAATAVVKPRKNRM